MGEEILTFGDIWMEKTNYRQKSPIFLKVEYIEKVLVSSKISSGEKKLRSTLLVTFIMIIKWNHYI